LARYIAGFGLLIDSDFQCTAFCEQGNLPFNACMAMMSREQGLFLVAVRIVIVMVVTMVLLPFLPFFLRIPMVVGPMVIMALVPFGGMLTLVNSHPLPLFRGVPAVIIPVVIVIAGTIPENVARRLLEPHSGRSRSIAPGELKA
jgi:hypothetical protein